jgi:Ca2+-binding EF-hand superfamily protein
MGDTKQQTEALKIAFAILKSIEREPEMEPNEITYSTLLKATAFLLPAGDERNKVASALFEKARAAGMIDVPMIQNMRKAVDSNIMRNFLAEMTDPQGHINYEQIPQAWSRNLRY